MFDMTTNGFVSTINTDDGNNMPRYRKELNAALSNFTSSTLPLYKELEKYRASNNMQAFNSEISKLRSEIDQKESQAVAEIDKAYSEYLKRLEGAHTVKENQVDQGILALLDCRTTIDLGQRKKKDEG